MNQTDDLTQLRKRLLAFAQARNWESFHSPKNLSMALIAECAELVEHFQWLTQAQSMDLSAEKHHQVGLELADIFIYLIRISDQLGIDLIKVANEKTTLNEKRFPVDQVNGVQKRASEYL